MENNNLNIIIENKIPFIKGILEPYARVTYLPPEQIDREAVKDADVIVVRTRNRCDRSLLEGSKVKMVCTATIGTDHLDLPYLREAGIKAANAPGCNAPAVAQYVMASIAALINRSVSQYTIGIVGVGHIGKIVERWARALDMRVLLCDPPRSREEGSARFVGLDTIAKEADIITFHTPLTMTGDDSTYHLADRDFFSKLRRAPIIINAARGPIVDTAALIEALDCGMVSAAVIDCWENEPEISTDLLERAVISTPHIAGYSRQGKIRATQMVLDAITAQFGLPRLMADAELAPDAPKSVTISGMESSYNPIADSLPLKSSPKDFETLRNGYPLRQEPSKGKID